MTNRYALLRPFIYQLSPEAAHQFAIAALRYGLVPSASTRPADSLRVNAFGMDFKTPLGLAAGFDKNAEVVDNILAQGFGFAEAGTVTPLPQPGNPKPRIFRLTEDGAVINRLGFNNKGLDAYCKNFSRHKKSCGIAGANIGKNKDSVDAIKDYVTCMKAVYPLADYITVNISSPNTKGLRDLQKKEQLDTLLAALIVTRRECVETHGKIIPLLLKIAPDIEAGQAEEIAELLQVHGIDGLIVSNTTLARPDSLKSGYASQAGGLSGAPLFDKSTELLGRMYKLTEGDIPLVGVGGISCADTAYAKIKAGATLIQLYSALVYQGFGLVRDISEGLAEHLRRDGFSSIQQAVGSEHR